MFTEVMLDTIYVLATREILRSVHHLESDRVVLELFASHNGLLLRYAEALSLELKHDSHQRYGVA